MSGRRLLALAALVPLAFSASSAVAGSSGPFSSNRDANFPAVTIGQSQTIHITITNNDSGDHTIDPASGVSISPTGTDFSIQNDTCDGALLSANGGSCTLDVVFAPTTVPQQTGSIDVTYDGGTPASGLVALSGSGQGTPTADLSTTSLGFTPIAVGASSQQTVRLTNNSNNAALGISSVSIAAGGADFSETNDCPATLAASSFCTATVTFAPSTAGALTGTLRFVDDVGTQNVALSGTGNGATADLSVTSPLDFGSVNVNASAPQTVTVRNNGNVNLTGITASISAGALSYATSADSCTGATVPPNATCSFTITFTPSAIGTVSGQLTLASSAFAGTQQLALTGVGTSPNVALDQTKLAFGSGMVGTWGGLQRVTLTNTGNAPLTIGAITIPGPTTNSPNPHSFRHGGTCPNAVVQPSASCTVTIRFTPQSRGTIRAQVSIPTSKIGASVLLTGSGTPPPAVRNGRGAVGCTSARLSWTPNTNVTGFLGTVIVRNRGHAPRTAIDGTIFSSSSPGVLVNTRLLHYTLYHYALFAKYRFYPSGPVVYSDADPHPLRTQRFCKPLKNGLISDQTPLIDWLPYSGALGYNLQVWHGGVKVYSPQMVGSAFQIPTRHAFHRGQIYTFKLYAYTRGHTSQGVRVGTSWVTVG
jgi:centrosomal CEP192-like protein/ASPM-SPD-2-Hydin domain-containing protein